MAILSFQNDSSHKLGLGSLSGFAPKKQIDASTDAQGRPTPNSLASDTDNAPSAATSISYPQNGKVQFVYEGDLSPKNAVSDARKWCSNEFMRQYGTGVDYETVFQKCIVLGVHVLPGSITVNIGMPNQGEFQNSHQKFPSRVDYNTQR